MSGFTKLHSSIIFSTIWQAPKEAKILWITLLAMADKNGEIHASLPGLAHAAVLSASECADAMNLLTGPDPHSRTPDNDGRRVEVIPGGWAILNYEKYRRLQSIEDAREKNVERQRRHREKNNTLRNVTVTKNNGSNDIAEAEAEAVQNPLTPLQGEIVVKAKRTRRTKAQIELEYPAEVHEVVDHCKAKWPQLQPATADSRSRDPINPDWCMLRGRVQAALDTSPLISPKVLCLAVDLYLAQDKLRFKAPQYFFSKGTKEEPGPWLEYARHAYSKLVNGNG